MQSHDIPVRIKNGRPGQSICQILYPAATDKNDRVCNKTYLLGAATGVLNDVHVITDAAATPVPDDCAET